MAGPHNKIIKGRIITSISNQKTCKGKTLLHLSFHEIQYQRHLVPFLDFTYTISILQHECGELVITDSKIGNCIGKAVCQRNSKVHIASPYSECQQHH